MRKKILAWFMAVAVLFSFLPVSTVQAEEGDNVEQGSETDGTETTLEVSSALLDEWGDPYTDVTIPYQESRTLEVTVNGGSGNYVYQWYKDAYEEGSKIQGATESSYEVMADENCGKFYHCEVLDAEDSSNGGFVEFWVQIDTGLEVESALLNEWGVPDTSVTIPYQESRTLEVMVSGGAGNYSYQWYEAGVEGDVEIEGAVNAEYDVLGNKDCVGLYRCEVTDGYMTADIVFYIHLDTGVQAVSNTGLNENDETESGTDRYVTAMYQEPLALEVEASGGIEELKYQWYEETDEEPLSRIEGATESSYELSGEADCMGKQYTCEVTDGICSAYVYFNITLDTGLKVSSALLDEWGDPYTHVTIPYQESRTLEVMASGGAKALSYQWFGPDDRIEGATGSSYEVLAEKGSDGDYICEVSDGIVTKMVVFEVTVDTGLTAVSATGEDSYGEESASTERDVILHYPQGEKLEITVSGGAGERSYQWYRSGYTDESDKIEGAITSSYDVPAAADSRGYYYCKVSDGIATKFVYFNVTIDTGLVAVSDTGLSWDGSEESSDDRRVTVRYRGKATLKVTVTGGAAGSELTYQWYTYEDGDEVAIEDAIGNSYEISGDVDCNDNYYCEVSDGIATKSVYFNITIDTGLEVRSSTGVDSEGNEGSSRNRDVTLPYPQGGRLEVEATGGVEGNPLTYQWYKSSFIWEGNKIEGANASSYEPPLRRGSYSCLVSDGVVEKAVYFDVEIDTGLEAVSDSGEDEDGRGGDTSRRRVAAEHDEPVTLNVIASGGVGDLTYQWYSSTIPDDSFSAIQGAATSSYTVPVNTKRRFYECIVSDGVVSKYVFFEIVPDTGLVAVSDTGVDWDGADGSSNVREVDAKYGKPLTLKVTASGGLEGSELTYQWYAHYDAGNILPDETGSSYTFIPDGGMKPGCGEYGNAVYYCEVTDGIMKKGVVFYVHTDNGLTAVSDTGTDKGGKNGSSNERNVTVKDGGEVILKVAAQKGEGGQNLTYQWYKSFSEGYNQIEGVSGNTCTVKGNKDTSEEYLCKVNDGVCERYVSFYMTVDKNVITTVNLNECIISVDMSNTTYTGADIKPQVTVKHGTKTLVEGTDYIVSYQNNVNIGTAKAIVTGKNNYTGTVEKTFTIAAKSGSIHIAGAYKYEITNADEVAFAGLKNAKTSKVNIPKTVAIGGKSFKITSIADNALKKSKATSVTIGGNVKTIGNSAFENCSKLTKVTVGAGVIRIGSKAFKNCKKLGTITVKSSKLNTVGVKAFSGIKANAKIKVPAKKLKAYKKLFKGKGQGKKVKITK